MDGMYGAPKGITRHIPVARPFGANAAARRCSKIAPGDFCRTLRVLIPLGRDNIQN